MSNPTEPINLLLSRDELLLTLRSLQAESIPGIDTDPLGNLTPDGLELMMTIAGRALQARELGQLREDGSLALHNLLLTAVGVCAYATQTVFVYHWPEDGAVPVRYFGHIRGNDFVAHTRPEDVLHLFSLLPTKAQMIEQILQLCGCADKAQKNGSYSLEVAGFGQVRQWAGSGDETTAVAHLTSHQADPEAAAALVSTLAHSPHISILQMLKQQDEQQITKYDFTIVQDNQHCWLVTPTTEDATDLLTVQTAVSADIASVLNDWL